jgi:fatty acid desaturase
MPLSEQEQRLLEEMERSLYQNDADFVATVNPRRGKTNYTILAVGVLVAVVGIATLVGGVIIQQPIVGVLGFAVMFVGVLLAVAPPRRAASVAEPAAAPKKARSGSRFMDNLNDRWDNRQDGRD